jgi:hypothetical protein
MMDDHAAYRYGFLLRCAEEGLGPDEAQGRAKVAGMSLADLVKSVAGYGAMGAENIGGAGLAGLALAAGVGGGGGYMLQKITSPAFDPEDIRRRELIDAYNAAASDIRFREAARRARPARKPTFTSY